MSEVLNSLHLESGIFLTLYSVPPIILSFLVGQVNKKLGKKRTARLAIYFACIVLLFFFVVHNPVLIALGVVCAASSIAFAMPSLNSAYADYVIRNPQFETEIEALQDFATNTGYVIGPILAGFLADKVGNLHSFGVLGVIGIGFVTFSKLLTHGKIRGKV
jgi:MFS family permease